MLVEQEGSAQPGNQRRHQHAAIKQDAVGSRREQRQPRWLDHVEGHVLLLGLHFLGQPGGLEAFHQRVVLCLDDAVVTVEAVELRLHLGNGIDCPSQAADRGLPLCQLGLQARQLHFRRAEGHPHLLVDRVGIQRIGGRRRNPCLLQFGFTDLLEVGNGLLDANHVRMLVGVFHQQVRQLVLQVGNGAIHRRAAHDRAGARHADDRLLAGYLPLQLRTAVLQLGVLRLGLLQRHLRRIEPGEVIAAFVGHQADILLLEIGQPVLGVHQALFVELDLLGQELLGLRRVGAVLVQGVLHEVGQDDLHHVARHLRIVITVGNGVDVLPRGLVDGDRRLEVFQQSLQLLRGRGTRLEAGLERYGLQLRPAEQRLRDHRDITQRVGIDREVLQQRPQHGLGVHEDTGRGIVLVRQLQGPDPAPQCNDPGNRQGRPPEAPHAVGVLDEIGGQLSQIHCGDFNPSVTAAIRG